MENEEMQRLVNLIDDVAEAAGIDRETMVPFEEAFVTELLQELDGKENLSDEKLIKIGSDAWKSVYPVNVSKLMDDVAEKTGMTRDDMKSYEESLKAKIKETLDGVEDLTDEDLISVGVALWEEVLLAEESATEETNNDNDDEQVEVIEPEEVVPDARTMVELQTEIEEVLNGNPMTIAKLASNIQCTKEFTGDIVSELIDLGLITKDKKTLHWVTEETTEETEDEPDYTDLVSDEPEVVESDVPHLEEPAEAPAETTNHAADHAIEVAFATAKAEVRKVLDQQRKASESNPAYKAQAEQYTEVMNSLRAVFDRLQNGPEQYHLHNPIIQELARIAEWQPEA